MYCKNCGEQIDDSAKFCQHCGANQNRSQKPAAPTMGKLLIKRSYTLAYSARKTKILVDGVERFVLEDGDSSTLFIHTGLHTIEVMMGQKLLGTTQVHVDGYSDMTVSFIISAKGFAEFEVTGVTTNPVPSGYSPPPTSPSTIEQTKSKNKGCLTSIIVAVVVIWLLWLILPQLTLGIEFQIVPLR